RLARTTGPQWVCETVSISRSRGRPVRRRTSRATPSDSERGMPTRSLVRSTSLPPAGSSSASALTYRSWSFPSAGLVRAAYPDIADAVHALALAVVLQDRPYLPQRDARRPLQGVAVDPAADGGEGYRPQPVLLHQREAAAVTPRQQLVLAGRPALPHRTDRVDD